MAGDNFDLQGWMREQKQGPYTGAKGVEKVALKSSKPKSKTGLNEGLMGMIDLQPVGHLSEEFNDDDFAAGMNDEEDLDNYFNSYPEDNELGKDEIAKELVNISSGHLNSRDFKDYIKDYYLNPEEYKIDTNSKYYEAITYAYNNEYEAYKLYDDQFEDNTENQMNEDMMDDDDFAATTAEVWASPSGELDAIIEFNGKKARVVEKTGEDVDKFWKMIAMKAKKMGATHIHSEENDPETESIEDILSSYMDEDSDIPTNDQDYTTQPGYVHEDDDMDDAPEIEDTWNKPSEFDKDDDEEKMAAMAMKQAKSSKKGMKGITADWTIDDILGGDDDDF